MDFCSRCVWNGADLPSTICWVVWREQLIILPVVSAQRQQLHSGYQAKLQGLFVCKQQGTARLYIVTAHKWLSRRPRSDREWAVPWPSFPSDWDGKNSSASRMMRPRLSKVIYGAVCHRLFAFVREIISRMRCRCLKESSSRLLFDVIIMFFRTWWAARRLRGTGRGLQSPCWSSSSSAPWLSPL